MVYGIKKISIMLMFIYSFAFFSPLCISGNQSHDLPRILNAQNLKYSSTNDYSSIEKIIVKYKDGIENKKKQDIRKKLKLDEFEKIEPLNMEIIKINDGTDVYALLNKLNSTSEIEYAEPSYERKLVSEDSIIYSAFESVYEPDDWRIYDQWGLNVTDMIYTWNKVGEVDRSKIKVAVLDSGVDYNHIELADNVLKDEGYDFVNNDYDPYDDFGHGTKVAGIIGAKTNNGIGISGVASGVKILPIKVLDRVGKGRTDSFIKGLMYAVDCGAHIINISFGGDTYSKAETDAIRYAFDKGVVIVAAAGNSGNNYPLAFPASYPGVISVGAIDKSKTIAYFSHKNSQVVAPGDEIYTTAPNNSYGKDRGTSFSAPFVAGLAALIIASSKDYKKGSSLVNTNEYSRVYQVGVAIENGCIDLGSVGFDSLYGAGLINGKGTFENTRYLIDAINDTVPDNKKEISVKAFDYTNSFTGSVSEYVYMHVMNPAHEILASQEVKLTNGAGAGVFEFPIGQYIAMVDSKDAANRTMDVGMDFTVRPVKPTANYASGIYYDTIEVELTCSTPNAQIIYTINDGEQTQYNGKITISSDAVLKVKSVLNNIESDVNAFTYNIISVITPTTTITPTPISTITTAPTSTMTPTPISTITPTPTSTITPTSTVVPFKSKKSSGAYIPANTSNDTLTPTILPTNVNTITPTILPINVDAITPTLAIKFEAKFSDINNHWAKEDIEIMAQKGIVKGIGENNFAPDDKTTRAQFASLLVRALDLTQLSDEGSFDDVTHGSWYYDSVNKAYKAGLVSGISDTEFKPDMEITREQMSVMIMKAYLYLISEKKTIAMGLDDLAYNDKDTISYWAKDSAAFCNKHRLILGDYNNYFNPKDYATRAQAVAVIRRMLEMTGKL